MKYNVLISVLVCALLLALTGSATATTKNNAVAKQPVAARAQGNSGTEAATVFADDFHSYTAGTQLVVQNSVDWGTWSGPPGSGEDPFVSSTYSSSAPNTFKVVSANDLIRLHGNPTSGVWSMTWSMYIPAGKTGYFNTMSEFTLGGVPPYYWTMECYFNAGGAGNLLTENPDAPFVWTADTWHTVEVIADLDNDEGSFLFNGVLIGTWVWTLGASGSGGPLQLADNDFYGAAATDEMYVDNYQVDRLSLVCGDIFFFNAKCNMNGAAQAMVKMTGDWSGGTIGFDLDGDDYISTIMSNGTNSIAKMTVPHAGMGAHTVTLESPGGCYSPVNFNCQVDAPPDPEWDALWAEYDALEAQAALRETVPAETKIIGNYPNPFNPSTTIRYALGTDSPVSVRVYNMLGQEVATLVNGFQKAGEQSVVWHGTNNFGQSVASGLYIYRLQAGNTVMTQKMLFTK